MTGLNEKTILIVDDEIAMLELLQIIFEEEEYHVLTANSAERGLEIISTTKADIIVSDIRMPPGMDGLEFLGKVRERDKNIPFILMTAYADDEITKIALDEGASYLIRKPFKPDSLIDICNRFLIKTDSSELLVRLEGRQDLVNEDIHSSKILIIDDEKPVLHVISGILRADGYINIKAVDNPLHAINLYTHYKPDVVILDLYMTPLDGYDVLTELKKIEEDSYLPVLILTGDDDKETRIKALWAGARDLISKPPEPIEFLARVKNIIEVKRLHNISRQYNRELEAKVVERTRELNDSRFEIIKRLINASELRDNETGEHVQRMSRVSAILGKELGLSSRECELLLHGSAMHDIGKIAISDSILLKPGPLTDEEWVIMKTHSNRGRDLLAGSNSELIESGSIVAATHHERWDGSGYPNGLKGEDIHLFGRIAAVADVFDALISVRPYKKAFPIREATAIIQNGSNTMFDPNIVDAFNKSLPLILKVVNEFKKNAMSFELKV